MQNILVIDDSDEIIEAVVASLTPIGVTLDSADSVALGFKQASSKNYSLIVIDLMLPDGDGFELFQKIRNIPNHKKTPVIFLTGKEDVASKISAFTLGADDYIVKPFHSLELRARVERRLKRLQEESQESDHISVGPLMLELGSQRLKIAGKEGYVSLTPREFKILLLFMKSPNRIFGRDHILKEVWGTDVFVTNRTVDSHVCYLRKKLDDSARFIQSIPGEGYRFNADK
ncbi:MAG: response regulator transcription factor [Bdellovibrionales bacterium]|nr:response regulator transcription factor [Bdellovibrionales bacterium]